MKTKNEQENILRKQKKLTAFGKKSSDTKVNKKQKKNNINKSEKENTNERKQANATTKNENNKVNRNKNENRKENTNEHKTAKKIVNKKQKKNYITESKKENKKAKVTTKNESKKVNRRNLVKSNKEERKITKENIRDIKTIAKNFTTSEKNIIVANLSYKETEDSIKEVFSKYGTIENVNIVKNKENQFQGKAVVQYKNKYDRCIFNEEIVMNNKILKVIKETIKNESKTYKSQRRVFLNHMNKDYKIIDIRNIIKKYPNLKIRDVRIKNEGPKMRNPGYCFVEFKSDQQAKWFVDNFNDIRIHFGDRSRVEYTNEKESENKK